MILVFIVAKRQYCKNSLFSKLANIHC